MKILISRWILGFEQVLAIAKLIRKKGKHFVKRMFRKRLVKCHQEKSQVILTFFSKVVGPGNFSEKIFFTPHNKSCLRGRLFGIYFFYLTLMILSVKIIRTYYFIL